MHYAIIKYPVLFNIRKTNCNEKKCKLVLLNSHNGSRAAPPSKSLCGTLGVEDSLWWQMVAARSWQHQHGGPGRFVKETFVMSEKSEKGYLKSPASSGGFLWQFTVPSSATCWQLDPHLRLCMFMSLIFQVLGFAFVTVLYSLFLSTMFPAFPHCFHCPWLLCSLPVTVHSLFLLYIWLHWFLCFWFFL